MVHLIPELIRNMNYARAVRGKMTREQLLREIDSQCETELGRHLDSSERNILFSRFNPDVVWNRVCQVCI